MVSPTTTTRQDVVVTGYWDRLAEDARERVREMLDIGFDVAAIADAAGLSRQTVRSCADGAPIYKRTAMRLTMLPIDQPVPYHLVPYPILKRMLDEMRTYGLSLQWIYRTAGVNPKFSGHYSGARCSWETYQRLRRVYDALNESGLAGGEDGGAAAEQNPQG